MYLFIEKALRGRTSYIAKRQSNSNNGNDMRVDPSDIIDFLFEMSF